MELFLHPWYMIAGGVLVSSPILIHLINRMRFKRVRWAAMEFLLKSQKRNRRRLIIQQLILLLLRILLVLLAGFLVARFVGTALASTAGGTVHLLVLDDTLSMSDRDAQAKTCFETAKEEIRKMAKNASEANSPQQLRVLLLSNLDEAVFDQRLNDLTVQDLAEALRERKPTALHIDPVAAVQKAQAYFNDVPQGQKTFHFVSDFRENDWSTGPGVEKLNEAVDKLLGDGVNVSLIDTAHPYRAATRQVALNHDNLAVVDLRAETRVAAEGLPVEFTVAIENYSAAEKKTFLTVKIDGVPDFSASRPLPSLPPSAKTEHKFQLVLAKKKPPQEVRESDSREDKERKRRADREFFQITAEIEAEETGLPGDNVRDLVVEVRRRVPALVVDGGGPESRQPGGDLFHVETAFAAARAYEVERRSVDDLEKANLDLYPSLFLLNVPGLKSDKAVQKLQDYVQNGGSVAYFLGDKVQAGFYNEVLYTKCNGLFPLLIAPRPTEPLSAEEIADRRQKDEQPKILFPDPTFPLVSGLYPFRSAFRYLIIDRYWPAQARYKWDPEPRQTHEAVVLPNRKSMDEYKAQAQELVGKAQEQAKELADQEKDFAKYLAPLEKARRDVIAALGTPYLFNLVTALDNLLRDPGTGNDPQRPNMTYLWSHPRMAGLGARLEGFRKTVLYGDPLVVTRAYGKGRVVAFLTSAGTASHWNEWGGGNPVSWSYPVFMMDLERFLTSQDEDFSRVTGGGVTLTFEAARYKPDVRATFQPQPDFTLPRDDKRGTGRPELQLLGTLALPVTNNVLTLDFHNTRKPGVYTFEATPLVEGTAEPQPETYAYAFNVDTAAESNLRRAARDKLERARAVDAQAPSVAGTQVGKIALRSPGDDYNAFKNRQPDASESPWLYLFFLLILVVEQAMAVHLSFHLKNAEAVPAPAPRTRTAAA